MTRREAETTDEQRNNKLQDATDAARKARAFHRIAKAVSLGGLEGAAIAALEEAAPFLIKLIVGLLIAVVLIPMLAFTGMPNMFFGFDSAETAEVMDMTRKAMAVGGAYISLKTFENTQVDAVVTGIVNEYENAGQKIDHVVVHSSFSEADLLWMIAINSVAFEQDLNTMTVESIWNLSYSSIMTTQIYTYVSSEKRRSILAAKHPRNKICVDAESSCAQSSPDSDSAVTSSTQHAAYPT